jgi:hypothetical protein
MNHIANDTAADECEEFYDSESEPSLLESPEKSDKNGQSADGATSLLPLPTQTPSSAASRLVYAVQFIAKSGDDTGETNQEETNRIFISSEKAMKLCKQDPDNRRFKAFKNFDDALVFSYGASSSAQTTKALTIEQIQTSISSPLDSPKLDLAASNGTASKPAANLSVNDAEKLPFSAPKEPEINELRSFIEKNKFESFRDKVVENPRFLISHGDAPVIVQVKSHQAEEFSPFEKKMFLI